MVVIASFTIPVANRADVASITPGSRFIFALSTSGPVAVKTALQVTASEVITSSSAGTALRVVNPAAHCFTSDRK